VAELVIGMAATPQRWRRELTAHVRDHVAGVRLVVLQDPREAFSSGVQVVVVDDTMDFLTPAQAVALRDQGVRVVGVYDPRGRQGRGRLAVEQLGTDVLVTIDDPPEVLLDQVARLTPVRPHPADGNGRTAAGAVGLPGDVGLVPGSPGTAAGLAPGPGPGGRAASGTGGSVVAVVGGSDSPGRTETAIAVAAVLAARSGPTVLADLDEHNPGVARRLGYHLAPNVLDALAAVHAGAFLGTIVGQRAPFAEGPVGFDVICGLANPNDWSQLRDVTTLLTALRRAWPHVVVDTGPSCEPDQVPPGGARNSATRTAIRSATAVLGVCTGTPLGVLRLLDWAAAAVELLDGKAMIVVVNRAPPDRFARDQLVDQLAGNLPRGTLQDVVFVPDDHKVVQGVWNASLVASGPFTGGVQGVTAQLVPGVRPAARRRFGGARR
jgi:MinD-like ATPase involved in chromosome partitioning or flagellar assembly